MSWEKKTQGTKQRLFLGKKKKNPEASLRKSSISPGELSPIDFADEVLESLGPVQSLLWKLQP